MPCNGCGEYGNPKRLFFHIPVGKAFHFFFNLFDCTSCFQRVEKKC